MQNLALAEEETIGVMEEMGFLVNLSSAKM